MKIVGDPPRVVIVEPGDITLQLPAGWTSARGLVWVQTVGAGKGPRLTSGGGGGKHGAD